MIEKSEFDVTLGNLSPRGLQAQGFDFHTLSRFESDVDKTLQKHYKQSTLNKFLGKE